MSDDSDLDDLLDGAPPGPSLFSCHMSRGPPGGHIASRDRFSEKSSCPFFSEHMWPTLLRDAGLTRCDEGAFGIGFQALVSTPRARRGVLKRAVARVSTIRSPPSAEKLLWPPALFRLKVTRADRDADLASRAKSPVREAPLQDSLRPEASRSSLGLGLGKVTSKSKDKEKDKDKVRTS